MHIQQRLLTAYKQFQYSPPTAGDLMRRNWRVLLLFVVMFGTVIAFSSSLPNLNFLAWVMAGMFVGVVARDFGVCRQAARAWPTLNAIIDWNRVDELLAKNG